jgi:predicted outer membrane protein
VRRSSYLWNGRCSVASVAEGRRTKRKLIRVASNKTKEKIMLRKRLATMFVPLFITGAAFADTAVSGEPDSSEKSAKLSQALSVLHEVGQWSISLSDMAEKKAKSDLVKDYARTVAAANAKVDEKLPKIAQKHGIEVAPLDPQTEEGKSVLDRVKAETALLDSLDGDAWDKEYMTLVTNTQQSVIHLLETSKSMAKDPDVRQFMGNLTTVIQNRLKTAQNIMVKVYGDQI